MSLSYNEVAGQIRKIEKISKERLFLLISQELKPIKKTRLASEQYFKEEDVNKLCHRLKIVNRDYRNITQLSKSKGYSRSTIRDLIAENSDKIKKVNPPISAFTSYNSKDFGKILKSKKIRWPYGIYESKKYRNLAPFVLKDVEGRITVSDEDHLNVWLVTFANGNRIRLKNALKQGGRLKYDSLDNFGRYICQGNEVSKIIKLNDTFGKYKWLVNFLFENVPDNLFSFDLSGLKQRLDADVMLHILSGKFSVNRSAVSFPTVNKFVRELNKLFSDEEFEVITNLLDKDNIQITFKSKEAVVKVPIDKKTYQKIFSEAKVNRQLDQNFLRNYLKEAFS